MILELAQGMVTKGVFVIVQKDGLFILLRRLKAKSLTELKNTDSLVLLLVLELVFSQG